jgi:hypothetical protein
MKSILLVFFMSLLLINTFGENAFAANEQLQNQIRSDNPGGTAEVPSDAVPPVSAEACKPCNARGSPTNLIAGDGVINPNTIHASGTAAPQTAPAGAAGNAEKSVGH